MRNENWGALTPQKVSEWINFDRNNPDWTYKDDTTGAMPERQAEGVAGLWNILATRQVALLADEVGMGKTVQALGVMAMLWKTKPTAKVLVMAPNRDICLHWSREYRAFLRDHYRTVDHLVRNGVDGGPVHEPHFYSHLTDLVGAVASGGGQFFLTTIHSLSNLVPAEKKDKKSVLQIAERAASHLHHSVKKSLGHEGFDLIIIDEAHYFRRADGKSQRAHAARVFFGDATSRIAQKALLLTATPSHAGMHDVANILGYFKQHDGDAEEASSGELLRTHATRRLRVMKGRKSELGTHYHNKYHYRHEHALPSSFENDPEAEMFFALYQKKLVMQQGNEGSQRRYMYGFLEGFESVPRIDELDTTYEGEVEEDSSTLNFRAAPDTQILKELSRLYREYFPGYPVHPKYSTLTRQCVPDDVTDSTVDLHERKHLIFVRRIPSVREITQRVNQAYDKQLAKEIVKACAPENFDKLYLEWEKHSWSRSFFNKHISPISSIEAEETEYEEDKDERPVDELTKEEIRLGSQISDLFTVKKTGTNRSTQCSNFSLRLRKPESLFYLLLEPASDYQQGTYSHFYRKMVSGRERIEYGQAALETRLCLHADLVQKIERPGTEASHTHVLEKPLPTLWGMLFDLITEDQRLTLRKWATNKPAIAENFGNYIKTGFLFASPVIIELYCWFVEFKIDQIDGDAHTRYMQFLRRITPRLASSLALQYFGAAIDTFELICEKITDHALDDWQKDWRALTSLQYPAWYASGESKNRQRLILGFNSPFYPNVLVATSVFQEGVNLHVQCRKVHHYGIAWTPGDNEQRVGRVDRLFGRVNMDLAKHGKAELSIFYPYLERSFDQEQVASFIQRKHKIEGEMDACRHSDFNDEIDLKAATDAWQLYLRKPDVSIDAIDPYPATFRSNELPGIPYTPTQIAIQDIAAHTGKLIASVIDPQSDLLLDTSSSEFDKGLTCLVESMLAREGKQRKQPILLQLQFLSELSSLVAGTTYTLTLRSPLATKATLDQRGSSFSDLIALASEVCDRYPLVRMAIDPDRSRSHFYFYLRVDLALFVVENYSHLLSTYEVEMAFNQLKHAADEIEWRLFDGMQDLTKESLDDIAYQNFPAITPLNVRRASKKGAMSDWQRQKSAFGEVVMKERHLSAGEMEQIIHARLGQKVTIQPPYSLLLLNHSLPLLNFHKRGKGITVTIAYPAEDVHEQEENLLNRWLDYKLQTKSIR